MNSEKHLQVLLMLSQSSVFNSAEKVFSFHGYSISEDFDQVSQCDLILFDAFFAQAGLKYLSPVQLWNKPAVLIARPDEIGSCGPCDDVILLTSTQENLLEKTFERWLEDTLHVFAICPEKTEVKGILSRLLMGDLRFSA